MKHLQHLIDPLSWHFAQLMNDLGAESSKALFLGALAASLATREQHACAYLPNYAGLPVTDFEQSPEDLLLERARKPPVFYPKIEPWQRALRRHSDIVGVPGEYKPLILENDRLYLYRYWDYETRLAQGIRARLSAPEKVSARHDNLYRWVQHLFSFEPERINWQAVAATTALHHRFHVVSGGPGTGKTTTVSRMVALLLMHNPQLRIVLAAPTGKAATRMKDSLLQSLQELNLPADIQSSFPTEALTLHRLLGFVPGQQRFVYHPGNLLPWDMVIVDEASMIDLAMMTRLIEALRKDTRLILLGDQHQLASVEAGSVLGDICQAARPEAFSQGYQQELLDLEILEQSQKTMLQAAQRPLDNHVVFLSHSYRFAADRGIGKLARCVQQGRTDMLLDALQAKEINHLEHFDKVDLADLLVKNYAAYFEANTPHDTWNQLKQFMILCALKKGSHGTQSLNQQVEKILKQRQNISGETWYHKRPVMITQNDYVHQLFNGDIGVTWKTPKETRVYFQRSDGTFKSYHPAQLGAHSTAWAMTIHKSQGSEFESLLMVLPPESHPLICRELIYTGITRARTSVSIWSPVEVLTEGIARKMQRYSGLVEKLS